MSLQSGQHSAGMGCFCSQMSVAFTGISGKVRNLKKCSISFSFKEKGTTEDEVVGWHH